MSLQLIFGLSCMKVSSSQALASVSKTKHNLT